MQVTPSATINLRKSGFVFPEDSKPIVQVINIEKFPSDRYKLQISDGNHFTPGMLATQHNELIRNGTWKQFSLIKIKEHIVNEVSGRQVLIILDAEIAGFVPQKIGNPVEFESGNVQQQQQQQQAPTMPAYAQNTSSYQQQQPMKQAQYQPPSVQHQPVAPSVPSAVAPQSYHPQQQQQQQQSFQAPRQQQPPPQLQQQYTPPPTKFGGSGPVSTLGSSMPNPSITSMSPRTLPIKQISPYQNKWTIRARVTSKSEVRSWNKGPTNQGKLFSVDLVDSEGSEIRATFFKEAVDEFYERIQVGAVYTFSEGKVKIANRNFSSVNHEYEISFDKKALISRVEDAGDISRINVVAVPIAELAAREAKTNVDIVAVVLSVSETQSFTSKAGKDLKKMELELADDSNASIRLTLWNTKIDDTLQQLNNAGPNPVVAIKAVQLGDFNGRTLSSIMSTSILVNPVDLPQAIRVRQWYDHGGATQGLTSLSSGGNGAGNEFRPAVPFNERATLQGITDVGLGTMGNTDYCEVKATIGFIRNESISYGACRTDKCQKKLIPQPQDGRFFCEKCGQTYDTPDYRYILSLSLADSTTSTFATAFNKEGMTILNGRSANDMEALKATDPEQFKAIIAAAQFQTGVFRLRLKEESFGQDNRTKVKVQVMDFKPVNFAQESRELVKGIQALMGRM